MPKEFITSGYLDVKISAKAKRGFTPWKAWKKQWCEIKRLDNIENGLEIKLMNTSESNSSNCFVIPRNATICRTESRTKNYSFGVFCADRNHKPLVFLSGVSESDSQLWMYSIRRLLSLNSHLPISNDGFYISIIDNDHSRIAGLTGLHGILTTNTHEVLILDPSTGVTRTSVSWYHLHQFHLAAPNMPEDEKRIIIIHTSKLFHAGAGQLHLFCLQAPNLLDCLVSKGKIPKIMINSLLESRRLSRSEGDLREDTLSIPPNSPTSPSYYYRSHCGSDDSGVRVSMASDDSNLILKCKKAVSYISLGFGLLVHTPGGSEIDNESSSELLLANEELSDATDCFSVSKRNVDDPRRESGVSVISGVYEEIPDILPPREFQNCSDRKSLLHTYEDPVDVILGSAKNFTPPPLPPRRDIFRQNSDEDSVLSSPNTPPIKTSNQGSCEDLISLATMSESEYMVMRQTEDVTEDLYMPMNSAAPLVPEENQYMVMSGKKTT